MPFVEYSHHILEVAIPPQINCANIGPDNVVFSEGLVQYKGKWPLYQRDAFLGVATTGVQP
jgi:hypothetical protein